MTASSTRGSLVTGTRPASGLEPTDRRTDGAIQMPAITGAADAHLATATPAVEQPERLPTHGSTDSTLEWTMPCDACIKGLRNCPTQAPHRRPGRSPNRSRAFTYLVFVAVQNIEDAALPSRRTRAHARLHSITPGGPARAARGQSPRRVHVKQRIRRESGKRRRRPECAHPQKQALLRHRQQGRVTKIKNTRTATILPTGELHRPDPQ